MKMRWKLLVILTLTITFFPSAALANGGSALLWTGILHLFMGNAVIGYIEGGLLSKFFNAPRGKATLLLVVANYTSAWLTIILLINRLSNIPIITIENIHVWLYIAVFLSFLLTLLIEYPFFWFLLRQQKKAIQKAIKATLIIHGISYLGLFLWYGAISQTSMLTQLSIVPAEQLQPSQEYVLYFMTDKGQAVRSDLSGNRQETIEVSDFKSLVTRSRSSFGSLPKPNTNTNWEYYVSVFAAGGISGQNRSENARFRFSFETPFAFWRVSNATHIEEDFVVFQLDKNQICILQPQEKKIALIARGREPFLVKVQSSDDKDE